MTPLDRIACRLAHAVARLAAHPIVRRVAQPVATTLALLAAATVPAPTSIAAGPAGTVPLRLSETGLYLTSADGAAPRTLRPDLIAFAPQYPLWSDGADKRRWLWLPPGRSIDASRPDAWAFPRGSKLWKEFAHAGRPVETRYIEFGRDGRWRFATYVWTADGREAALAPDRGIAALPVAAAPGGRYAIPGVDDCRACHESNAVPVIGFAALQLSPDRDPLAPGARPLRPGELDLPALAARGLLRALPRSLLATPPRIAAESPDERAALGYLHGNCGHCHNRGPTRVPVRLTLAQRVADPAASRAEVLGSTFVGSSAWRAPEADPATRVVVPGDPAHSVLAQRMRTRVPQQQMPPLGTQFPDPEGLALIERWIANATHP